MTIAGLHERATKRDAFRYSSLCGWRLSLSENCAGSRHGNVASTQTSFAAAAESLKLLDENAYRGKEKKFHSALGRFSDLGVPVTAIALGAFFSYWEAYSRSAASVAALSI